MKMTAGQVADSRRKRQGGIAMLVTSLVLVLVVMLALSALDHSEQEYTGAARGRGSTRVLQAADAGIQLGLGRLAQSPPKLDPIDVDLDGEYKVQSRTQLETTPQDLRQVGLGTASDGYAVNVGSGVGSLNRIYRVTVTANTDTSSASVEAKLSRVSADVTGY